MNKAERESLSVLEMSGVTTLPADSGLGSTAPSEIVDSEFTNSQEELDVDLGSLKSKSEFRNGGVPVPLKTTPTAVPHRSATADGSKTTAAKGDELSSKSEGSLNHVLTPVAVPPPILVTMASASTATSGSGTSIAVEGADE